MPVAMTFLSLLADLGKYAERGGAADPDVQAEIPALINLAERRCARDMKVEGLQQTVSSMLRAGQSVYPKPDRWRDTISINYGAGTAKNTRTPVFARSYEYVRNFWPDDTLTAPPRFYADYDQDHWIVMPPPDADYPVEILYHQMAPPLDATNQTNWLTRYAPDALLYAALSQLSLFTRAYDQVAIWDNKYKEAIAAVNGENSQRMADRAATRQGA